MAGMPETADHSKTHHRPPQDCQENRRPPQNTDVYIVCDTVSLADTK